MNEKLMLKKYRLKISENKICIKAVKLEVK